VLVRKVNDGQISIALRQIPGGMLCNDAALRDMARLRPSTPTALLSVRGVGEKKPADVGQRFIEEIVTCCRENRLALDTYGDCA